MKDVRYAKNVMSECSGVKRVTEGRWKMADGMLLVVELEEGKRGMRSC